jgi:UDP-N-acetylmuramoyl-L-alanyl-D-glutamate--2,6-diaminopimelate ligase
MQLSELIQATSARCVAGPADVLVRALTADSRTVGPGSLFAALPGSSVNGARFIPAAVAAGAVAVLASDASAIGAVPASVAVLRAAEPRLALAQMAARLHPRQPAVIVAVTGTNGKTSIAEFTRQIFARLGHRAASLGTLGVVTPEGADYGSLTTPDPVSLHQTLDRLAADGITHLALEASSHGLDQFRLDGVRLTAAAFNNLGRDHLDYHPTMAAYFDAKMQLFERLLQPGQPAIINSDGTEWTLLAEARARQRRLAVTTVGSQGTTLRLLAARSVDFAQQMTVATGSAQRDIKLDLVGTYQAANALVAAGLAIASGADAEAVLKTLPHLRGVPGRLDIVGHHNGGLAVVDYAHKPEALAAALAALRPFATGKLITVFGCGGNRDKGKRPIMAQIAERGSDVVIVTDDNPRREDPATIRAEILAGAPGLIEIGDRAAAIRAGVDRLGPGDVLLVAGKGHETGQIIGDVTLPFSDHDVIRAAIAEAGR